MWPLLSINISEAAFHVEQKREVLSELVWSHAKNRNYTIDELFQVTVTVKISVQ